MEKRGASAGAGAYAGLGIQFAVSVVVFAYAGVWLDRRLGSSPLCTIIGVFVGAGGAFYSMIHRLKGDMAANREKR
jgi:F0F1-type ATP synthase assembly protein I